MPQYEQSISFYSDAEAEHFTPTIGSGNLLEWWAAYLCGARRGEFNGKVSFGPNWLDILNWRNCYMNEFEQTPFLWAAGLLTMLPFKPMVSNQQSPTNSLLALNWDTLPIEELPEQRVWASPLPTERWSFLHDWLTAGTDANNMNNITRCRDLHLAAALLAKMGPYANYKWQNPLGGSFLWEPIWRNYRLSNVTTRLPYKPEFMDEAHLQDSQRSTDATAWGKYKELFAAGLTAIKNQTPDPDFPFYWGSDAAAMDYVENQYDGSVTVDKDRVIAIASYLATTVWNNENEWQCDPPTSIRRPPNWVKITMNGNTEFYSLSEAWWHMLAALDDINQYDDIVTSYPLEPVVGPSEPQVYDVLQTEDNVYRLFQWGQNDQFDSHLIKFKTIKTNASALLLRAYTDPTGPIANTNRQQTLRRVVWKWPLKDAGELALHANAAECLYIMAKGITNWVASSTPADVAFLPSHMLPYYYYRRLLWDGQYQLNMFGSSIENQMNWLELGQMWTIKPAVLKTAYR